MQEKTEQPISAKEYLKRVKYLDDEIDSKERIKLGLQRRLSLASPQLKADKVQGSKGKRTTDIIDNIADLDEEINDKIAELCILKKESCK